MAPVYFDITDGPSKYDLMLALFDRTSDRPRPVVFQITRRKGAQPITATCGIITVGIEDGSGESWLIELTNEHGDYYHGWYNTQTRKGVIEPGLRRRA